VIYINDFYLIISYKLPGKNTFSKEKPLILNSHFIRFIPLLSTVRANMKKQYIYKLKSFSMKTIYSLLFPVFFLLSGNYVSAQSPGGISVNLTLWVKSNSNISTTGSLVDSWGYANNGNSFTSTGTDRPTLTASVINFNPVVRFTGGRRFMDGPTGASAPITALDDDYTVFVVWESNTVSAFQRVWIQKSNCAPCNANDAFTFSTWNDGRYGDEAAISPFDHTVQRNYTAGAWNISQLNLLNQATSDLEIIDDRNISTGVLTLNTDPSAVNGAALRVLNDQFNRIGSDIPVSGGSDLDGDVAEIIVFDRPISGGERNSIFSYLALKYGITVKTDLLSSASATIWNATTNSTYNNSVFGLGLDNTSGLSITQSNSIENGSGNGTGQSGKANVVLSSPSSLNDQDFLIIGNDNGALTQTGTDLPSAASASLRLGREWKVQHTGNAGTVNASFDLTGLTISGVTPGDFRLMIDEDGNGDFTNGTIRYYTPTSYAGNVATFTGITLNNNEVFALITSASPVTLPVNWVNFTGKLVNKNVRLDWEVTNNESASVYEIEHSTDGLSFNKVGVVNNQPAIKTYRFTYPSMISGVTYFRIRQIDLDGRAFFSKTISVKSPDITMHIVNNPARDDNAEIEINVIKRINGFIELSSISGATINSQKIVINPGINRFKLPMAKAASGTYIIKLKIGDTVLSERILKL
jgi:hypothetical protein